MYICNHGRMQHKKEQIFLTWTRLEQPIPTRVTPSPRRAAVGFRWGVAERGSEAERAAPRDGRRVEAAPPEMTAREARRSSPPPGTHRTRAPAPAARCCASCGGLAPHRGLRLPAVAHRSRLAAR